MSTAISHLAAKHDSARTCWRSIGVYHGDQSCIELAKVAHCRNCTVFQEAARSVYRRFSAEAPESIEHSLPVKLNTVSTLVLQIGRQWLGLHTGSLIEVVADRAVRKIAHRNALKLEGLTNVRGELHLCVNVRAHFEFGSRSAALERARMVLMNTPAQRTLAFRADCVDSVLAIDRARITAVPASLPKALQRCALGTFSEPARDILLMDVNAFIAELEGAWYA